MTDLEICIAILSYCGWNFDPPETRTWKSRDRWCKSPAGEMVIVMGMEFPRPDTDLNAMHEVEKTLMDAQWITYIAFLHKDIVIYPMRRAVHATARQRCEAFIKTVCPENWKGKE